MNNNNKIICMPSIKPLEVIEAWNLCHHLACAVSYLSKLNARNPRPENLKKAEWHLMRELTRYQKGFNKCHWNLVSFPLVTPEAVFQDWRLSFHLGRVLEHIKKAKDGGMKEAILSKALEHLRAEITAYEQRRKK